MLSSPADAIDYDYVFQLLLIFFRCFAAGFFLILLYAFTLYTFSSSLSVVSLFSPRRPRAAQSRLQNACV